MGKYILNENKFKEVNLLSSYWAGFIAADGNIKKPKYGQKILTITLSNKDKTHLRGFKKFLKTDKPIYDFKNEVCSIEVSSNEICKNLLDNFNIDTRKTFNIEFPDLELKDRLPFIIGYIDGDGCLYIDKKTNYLSLSVVGTESMLRGIEKTFNKILGITTKRKLYSKTNNEIYDIRWNNKQARVLVKYLENILIGIPYLRRKWDKSIEHIDNYIPFKKSISRCAQVKEMKGQGKSNKEIMKVTGLKSKTSIYNCLNK